MTISDRDAAALAELREKHPDRPAYIHPIHGVPCVGPTFEEQRELAEVLDQEGQDEAKRLRDPAEALAFLRECNGERHEKHARFLALGKRIKAVDEVVAVGCGFRFRSSATEVVARIRTKDGRRKLVRATLSHDSGSYLEPPCEDADVQTITEEEAAKLRASWEGATKL